MATKLQTLFEKTVRNKNKQVEHQVLILSAEVDNRRAAEELGYEDFKLDLFINGKFIADISPVLAQTGVFNDLIDSEKWEEKYSASNKMQVVIHKEIEMP